jgi:hypothetical protein
MIAVSLGTGAMASNSAAHTTNPHNEQGPLARALS